MPNNTQHTTTIDFTQDGKHFGHYLITNPSSESGWGSMMIPIISVRNGEGPCLLLTAGNHGDEFEGQIALRKLALSLKPEEINGQVLIVPAMNLPAVINNSRLSPIDGGNLNRLFPGNARGTITERIAAYINDELIRRADLVIDLHSAGRSINATPLIMAHRKECLSSVEVYNNTLDALRVFAAPISLIFDEPEPYGLFDAAVETAGKIFMCTELGGFGALNRTGLSIALSGIRNIMIHMNIMEGEIDTGSKPTQFMETPDGAVVYAQAAGLFENFVELGDRVEPGQAIGQMYAIADAGQAPIVHHAQAGGLLIMQRTAVVTEQGDILSFVAQSLDV